jgi:hypothetical protein
MSIRLQTMGAAKDWQLEQQARGWYSGAGFVCAECVYDRTLAALIRAEVTERTCDFCGAHSSVPIAADIDIILCAVAEGFYAEYEDPINQVWHDSSEGGYQLPLMSTFDLAFGHEVSENDKVLDAVVGSIQHDWVQRDPYRPSPYQALAWGWSDFREQVMHKRRFTFLVPSAAGTAVREYGEIPPEDMLAALANGIAQADLIQVVPQGTAFWRARPHNESQSFDHAKELGSPPPMFARTNRMSAAGISAFYGASAKQVAIDEVRGYAEPDQVITVAKFVLSRPITIVDLVGLPPVPSLFDAANRDRRPATRFLHSFAADVAQISRPDDRQHLDYVPTQIVSEYLRFQHPSGPVGGLRWRSTKNSSETATVLFLDNDACVDRVGDWDFDDQPRLGLDPTTVERVPPAT